MSRCACAVLSLSFLSLLVAVLCCGVLYCLCCSWLVVEYGESYAYVELFVRRAQIVSLMPRLWLTTRTVPYKIVYHNPNPFWVCPSYGNCLAAAEMPAAPRHPPVLLGHGSFTTWCCIHMAARNAYGSTCQMATRGSDC
jgi:hypothetical protein